MSEQYEIAAESLNEAVGELNSHHQHHLDILHNIVILALDRAQHDPLFSFDDAEETIQICEAWVEQREL